MVPEPLRRLHCKTSREITSVSNPSLLYLWFCTGYGNSMVLSTAACEDNFTIDQRNRQHKTVSRNSVVKYIGPLQIYFSAMQKLQ